jgi:hypothetical protein
MCPGPPPGARSIGVESKSAAGEGYAVRVVRSLLHGLALGIEYGPGADFKATRLSPRRIFGSVE